MSTLAERLTTPSGKVAGRIEIELTDDEMQECRELAARRNESYDSGATEDTNFADESGQEIHTQGLVAEYALSLVYENATVDTDISAAGDGGVDAQIEYEGELVDADVKASSYEDAWLLVREDSPTTGESNIYVSSYVDGDYVEIVGLVESDDLLQESNLEESPSPRMSHLNYTAKGADFDPLPEPTADDLERVDYE
jgi:hypothetical protein